MFMFIWELIKLKIPQPVAKEWKRKTIFFFTHPITGISKSEGKICQRITRIKGEIDLNSLELKLFLWNSIKLYIMSEWPFTTQC